MNLCVCLQLRQGVHNCDTNSLYCFFVDLGICRVCKNKIPASPENRSWLEDVSNVVGSDWYKRKIYSIANGKKKVL